MVPIAVTTVSALSMGGALGVAIGAANDDFPFGLKIGFSVGAVIGALVYWFALRDRPRR